MATFFALLFGLVLGVVVGVIITVALILDSADLRDFYEKIAFDSRIPKEIEIETENEEL